MLLWSASDTIAFEGYELANGVFALADNGNFTGGGGGGGGILGMAFTALNSVPDTPFLWWNNCGILVSWRNLSSLSFSHRSTLQGSNEFCSWRTATAGRC